MATMTRAGLTLASAESLTGGGVAARVVDVPGASAVLRGGVVAYATDLKAQILGVDQGLLSRRGAVDPDVALAMAAGVRRLLGADVGVSTTGVAGPDPQDGVAPGTVYVAVDDGRGRPLVRRLDLEGARDAVRSQTVAAALHLVLEVVDHP
jgi:nicotinamide-nucleotide amidase